MFSFGLHDMLLRYDDTCGTDSSCTIMFTPTVNLVNPKIYYSLENFYVNHRNFVKSRSYKQMRGNILDSDSISTCDYALTNGDMGYSKSVDGSSLSSGDVAYPCGLIGKYIFNDTFTIMESLNGTLIPIDETNIA